MTHGWLAGTGTLIHWPSLCAETCGALNEFAGNPWTTNAAPQAQPSGSGVK